VRGNVFGRGGFDRNGRDLTYDGSGSGNCFGANRGVTVTVPSDGSTMAQCPLDGANRFSPEARDELVGWTAAGAPTEHWLRNPHAPLRDATIQPLERFAPGVLHGPRGL